MILTSTAIPFSHFPTHLLPFEKNRVPSPWNLVTEEPCILLMQKLKGQIYVCIE